MTTAMIIGHSFVSGLEHHLQNLNGGFWMSPEQVSDHLEISDRIQKIVLSGISGAQIWIPYGVLPHGLLRIHRPDVVILQIGTNDLAAGKSPAWVSYEVMNQAKTLLEVYNVQYAVVCSALFREGGVHDHIAFRDVIREFNDRLFFACQREMLIGFHSHDGFWGNPVSV